MRISDWSSDVCSSDLWEETARGIMAVDWLDRHVPGGAVVYRTNSLVNQLAAARAGIGLALLPCYLGDGDPGLVRLLAQPLPELTGELWIVTHTDLKGRSEEHTSELQSLMRISYAVFCLKKKTKTNLQETIN